LWSADSIKYYKEIICKILTGLVIACFGYFIHLILFMSHCAS